MSYSYSSLQKESLATADKMHLDVDLSGVLEIVKIGFKSTVDQSISKAYESTVNTKLETKETKEITEEFIVGANSNMTIYRLVYSGPGVTYATETISSHPTPIDDVIISCTVKQKALLKDIMVVYSALPSQRPSYVIEDRSVANKQNVNYGFGGKCVWLVPIWTKSKVRTLIDK